MKKIISILALAFLLVSCGGEETTQDIPSQTNSGTQVEMPTQTPETGKEDEDTDENETQTGSTTTEENQSDDQSNQEVDPGYGFSEASNNGEEESSTGTQVEIDAEANAEISGSEEEQLIEETMDELNEFFELLEETNE